jgi:hypothetical protein
LDAAIVDDTAAAAVPAVGQLTGILTAGAERDVFLFTGLSGVRSKLNSRRCSSLGKIVVRREEETDIYSFTFKCQIHFYLDSSYSGQFNAKKLRLVEIEKVPHRSRVNTMNPGYFFFVFNCNYLQFLLQIPIYLFIRPIWSPSLPEKGKQGSKFMFYVLEAWTIRTPKHLSAFLKN